VRLRAPRDAVSLAGRSVTLSDGTTADAGRVARGRAQAWKLRTTTCAARCAMPTTRAGTCIPGQLVTRYAAVFSFFRALDSRRGACAVRRSTAQATLLGSVFDDAATGQGLLNYFLRGLAAARS
jgi:hypothetical protein